MMSDRMKTADRVNVESPPRGWMYLDGWAGRASYLAEVVGETPKRGQIKALTKVRLPGRERFLLPGETALVPRYAVRFTEQPLGESW